MFLQVSDQPLFAVAGFWRRTEKSNNCPMVTCDAYEVVPPIHPKAMIIAMEQNDREFWLTGGYDDVIVPRRPYDAARIAVRGPDYRYVRRARHAAPRLYG